MEIPSGKTEYVLFVDLRKNWIRYLWILVRKFSIFTAIYDEEITGDMFDQNWRTFSVKWPICYVKDTTIKINIPSKGRCHWNTGCKLIAPSHNDNLKLTIIEAGLQLRGPFTLNAFWLYVRCMMFWTFIQLNW